MSKSRGLLQLVGTGRGRLEQVVGRKDQELQDSSSSASPLLCGLKPEPSPLKTSVADL